MHQEPSRPRDAPRPPCSLCARCVAGDSGGPLTFNVKNAANPLAGTAADDRLVGVVSYG
jgi:hypothetical protein